MKIEKKLLEGREHWVVPTVLIRVGEWAGSQGPTYYSPEVLEESAPFWNGKPIVVYHPKMYGSGLAGDPEIFNKQKVGTIFAANFDGDKLRCESWLDPERLEWVDSRVYDTLQKRQPIGVSTGLTGFSEGKKTIDDAIMLTGILPDHLAILPDQKGACPLSAGAGLLLNVGGCFDETLLPLPSTA